MRDIRMTTKELKKVEVLALVNKRRNEDDRGSSKARADKKAPEKTKKSL